MQNVDIPDMDGILRLNADGSFVLRADDSGSMETTSPGGKLFSTDIQFNMERRGTWTLNGDRLEQCYSADIDIGIEEIITDPDGNSETFSMLELLGAPQSYTIKRRLSVSVGSTPHSLSRVDMRFRPFIDLKGVSLWNLRTSFSQEYRAVQMAIGGGLLN